MREYRNNPWFASTFTTATGIALEYAGQSGATTGAQFGASKPVYRLRGFAISGSTAIAISTLGIKIIYGDSSETPATTATLCAQPGAGSIVVDGILGIEAGYIALESTVAHADGGLYFAMWGD